MYVLALLFGIVNFYFLLSGLIVILSLFTEYVQVPLINYGAKLFYLPIAYTLERSFPSSSNTNVFNTIINQTKQEEKDDTDNQESDSDDNEDNSQDENSKCDFLKPACVEKNQEASTDPEQRTEESDENDNLEQDLNNKEFKSNDKKSDEIFIDETLD
jgi:hypothetical protein